MIRPAAAKEAARRILVAMCDEPPSEVEVSLAASLIVKAVEADEKAQHAEAIEEML